MKNNSIQEVEDKYNIIIDNVNDDNYLNELKTGFIIYDSRSYRYEDKDLLIRINNQGIITKYINKLNQIDNIDLLIKDALNAINQYINKHYYQKYYLLYELYNGKALYYDKSIQDFQLEQFITKNDNRELLMRDLLKLKDKYNNRKYYGFFDKLKFEEKF